MTTTVPDMKVLNQAMGERWIAYHGDCVEVLKGFPDNSVGYIITSVPFKSLYCYSNSDRDLANTTKEDQFFEHYTFLSQEMMRVLMPGRLMSIHCMDLPRTIESHGFIGLEDFPGDIIRHHQRDGMLYHSRVTIWKDPLTAMHRTHAVGLLYKELVKDSAISRQGIADYLVTLRKPGRNEEPVIKNPEAFPAELWRNYASPVWMDINPSDTLQKESARDARDDKHIAPLQLEVIRRGIKLWTNPGDVVLDPFGGIGSLGFVALEQRRKAALIELKPSYFRQMCRNLEYVEALTQNNDLFTLAGIDLDALCEAV